MPHTYQQIVHSFAHHFYKLQAKLHGSYHKEIRAVINLNPEDYREFKTDYPPHMVVLLENGQPDYTIQGFPVRMTQDENSFISFRIVGKAYSLEQPLIKDGIYEETASG
jgi:hypothetical protein